MLEFFREGTPFWVYHTLASSTDTTLVTPRGSNRGAVPFGAGDHLMEENRLILLGYRYQFTAAAGNGFSLVWTDNQVTPAVERTIIQDAATADALTRSADMPFCFLPGPQGLFSPAENGAALHINFSATGPTAGSITVWGIHVDAAWKPGKSFTGSPISF